MKRCLAAWMLALAWTANVVSADEPLVPIEDEPVVAQAPVTAAPIEAAPVDATPTEAAPVETRPSIWQNLFSADFFTSDGLAQAPPFAEGCERWWFEADMFVGWVQGMSLPPLVTTSSQADKGVLGRPSTNVLFGNEEVNGGARLGVKGSIGRWLDAEHDWAVEVGAFMLASETTTFTANSPGDPLLARPFFSINSAQNSVVIATTDPANPSNGTVRVDALSGSFAGFHLDFSEKVIENSNWRLDALIGYRYLRFDEQLDVQHDFFPTGGLFVPGTQLSAHDSFEALNDFHGGEVGFKAHFHRNRWSLDVLTKLAVGRLYRQVNVDGSTRISVPGTEPVNQAGGMLALSSNIGRFLSDEWILVPEIGLNLGWQLNQQVQLQFGYSFLHMNRVARVGEQVDLVINDQLFPPAVPNSVPLPLSDLNRSDIWIQGISFGIEFKF